MWSGQCACCLATCLAIFHTADECSTTVADCVDNSTCINSPDGFVCLCPPGLTGDGTMSGNGCTGKNYTNNIKELCSI